MISSETSLNFTERISQGESTIPTSEIETVDRRGTFKSMELDLVRIDMGPRSSIMVQLRDITEHKKLEVTLQRYKRSVGRKGERANTGDRAGEGVH